MYTIIKEGSSLIFAEQENKEIALEQLEAMRIHHWGTFYIATEHELKQINLFNTFDVPTRNRLKNRLREFLSDNNYTKEQLEYDEHLNLISLNKWDSLHFLAFDYIEQKDGRTFTNEFKKQRLSLAEQTSLKKYIARLVLFSNY